MGEIVSLSTYPEKTRIRNFEYFCSSPIIRKVRSVRVNRHLDENRNDYKVLVGKPEGHNFE